MTAILQETQVFQTTPLTTTHMPERAPHKRTRKGQDQPHISASQLRNYAGCPLAWRLSRTHRPEHISAALLFGSAFHAAAEALYQARLEGKAATHQDLMAAYDAAWLKRCASNDGEEPIPIRYSAKTDEIILRETASRMLEAFLVHVERNVGEVIAVEEPFEVTLAPDLPPLQGRIDLIEIRTDASGKRQLCICDFKTSAKHMSEGDVDVDQLNIYAIAARKTGLLDQIGLPLALRVDCITKTKTPETDSITLPPDARGERRVVEKARQIWKSMAAGVCYPASSWRCTDCGYKTLCAKWPE